MKLLSISLSLSHTFSLLAPSNPNTLIHKWQILSLLNVNQIQSEIYSKQKLHPTTDLSYRNEFLTYSSKVKIQRFTPAFPVVPFRNNTSTLCPHRLMSSLLSSLSSNNFRTNSPNAHNNIHIEYIYYNFCSPCDMRSLIYLACDWIFGCSTLIPAIQTSFRNRMKNIFSFSLVASRHRQRRRFPRNCVCCGIRFCPCTFHHFTSRHHPCHNIHGTCTCIRRCDALPSSPHSIYDGLRDVYTRFPPMY